MRFCVAGLMIVMLGIAGTNIATADDDWVENSPFYEEDAWYDITEWFDGNDYNPTNEDFFEWDDEVYEYDPDSGEVGYALTYGYDSVAEHDDWFYDNYDYGYDEFTDYDNNDLYESGFRYYDLDNDGTYDAYMSWYDWDNDGVYDDYTFTEFSDSESASERGQSDSDKSKQKERAKKQAPKSSLATELTGSIENMKQVKVRGSDHTVVALSHDGQSIAADLGKAKNLDDLKLEKGKQITVTGMKTKVGDKHILVAKKLTIDGEQTQVDRSRPEWTAEVVETRTAKVQGREHKIAIVKNDNDNRVAVDFGPADKLDMEIKKGEKITFTGAPIKVNDKRMMMAQSIEHNGETIKIDRRKEAKHSKSTS